MAPDPHKSVKGVIIFHDPLMNHELNNEKMIRSFLLGRLSAAEEDEFEIGLLGSADFQTAVEVAEFDLIDDYVRGVLAADEVSSFQSYFLNSSDRHAKLKAARVWPSMNVTRKVKDDSSNKLGGDLAYEQERAEHKPKLLRRFFPFDWRWAVPLTAGIVLLVVGSGVIQRTFFQSPVEQAVAILKKVYKQERPIESRLSGFNHSPWVQRRGDEKQSIDSTLRDEAALILLGEVNNRPTPQSRQALGNLNLLGGKTDEAIKQLETALKNDPDNARIHNDLGVALMELGKSQSVKGGAEKNEAEQVRDESLILFGRANEHFSLALKLDNTLNEALFNQSLCLQQLGLIDQAKARWNQYLQIDRNSEWANEARRKLAELEEQKNRTGRNREQLYQSFLAAYQEGNEERAWQVFGLSHEQRGNLIADRLLDEYLVLLAEGNEVRARQKSEILTRMGEIAANRAGDHYIRDLAGFYRAIRHDQVSLLVTARSLLKAGYDKNKTSKPEALILYRKARDNFVQAGSVCEIETADVLIGTVLVWMPEYKQQLESVDKLVKTLEKNQHIWLQGQSLWLRSNLDINSREYSQALASVRQAAESSHRLGDLNGEAGALSNIIGIYYFTGDSARSIVWLQRCLDLASQHPLDSRIQWRAYGTASNIFNDLGLFYSAVAYEREAMALNEIANQPLLQSRSYAYLGEVYGNLNNYEQAIQEVKQALEIGKTMTGDPVGKNISAHALLRLGHLYRKSGQQAKAMDFYDESIRLFEQIQWRGYSGDAHRGKMLIHLDLKDDQSAEADFHMARQLFEENLSSLTVESLRNSFFDAGQDIYDLAIRLFSERLCNPEQAFNYSETGRARSLLILMGREIDGMSNKSGIEPLPLSEIRKRLPASVQLIQYAVLSEKLYVWLLSDTKFYSATVAISLNELTSKVRTYLEYTFDPLKANPHEAEKISSELYDILIKPVEQSLDTKRQLCIVPDKILNYLPFGSLVKPGGSSYLIEKYTITVSPSSTVFLACTSAAEKKSLMVEEQCLSVGRPQFIKQSDLPSTEWEAGRVAGYYDRHRLLLADQATKEQICLEMPKAEVIHLASHGLVNELMPEYSGIVLSTNSTDAGLLTDDLLRAGEVSQMKLPRTRLVVLSACQTGLGRNYRGEGMVGLARAFLAAGSPQVVASLQPVDSLATARLMDKFHGYRKRAGLSTAYALRQAQLEMLQGPDKTFCKPAAWAAFTAIGGYANY